MTSAQSHPWPDLACVLFDLDGTLLDTAPDLIAALNNALLRHGLAPINTVMIRPLISLGVAAMARHAVGAEDETLLQTVIATMLDHYQTHLAEQTQLYAGMNEVLTTIEARGLQWGVVTNKKARFTEPLLAAFGLAERAACIVSGDTTPHSKPHPEPLRAASQHTGVAPARCVYIGDAAHDITAGRAAGMRTLAAGYGYLKPDDRPENWAADAIIGAPRDILAWLPA